MAQREHSDPRQQLAELLRSRRERLQPTDVGLPAGPRRRTPGLRREEVAQLAAISPTYYTFLEQGRDISPSREVLDALARALRLDAAERAHLHDVARGRHQREAAATAPLPSEHLPSALAELVDRLDPHPAYVTGRRWDVLAANRAACLLWIDWPTLPLDDRNMIWWTFTDPAARTKLVDWEAESSTLLARLRAAAARHPDDPRFAHLAERLHAVSPEVREWWPRHEVAGLASGTKRMRHPALGEVELRHVVLQLADDPDQKLVSFTADDSVIARIAELIARR